MDQLLQWNARGLIPGPKEDELHFFKRVSSYSTTTAPPLERVENLYGFSPDWLDISFSNKGLLPWHMGITIVEDGKCRLQLRKKGVLSSLYDQEEVISHEAVHAARGAFDEPLFEEILAYQTSKRGWRRFFGPLFQSSTEAILVTLAFSAHILTTIGAFFIPALFFFHQLTFILSLGLSGLLLLRLTFLQCLFFRCRRQLTTLLGCPKKALATMLRLTDREITTFAFSSPSRIATYIRKHKRSSLRWKLLYNFSFESCDASR